MEQENPATVVTFMNASKVSFTLARGVDIEGDIGWCHLAL